MRLGELTTLVVFEHSTRQRDDVLNQPAEWGEFGRAWCGLRTTPGGESATAGQTTAAATLTLETHWTPALASLTPQMRAVVDGQTLGIQSVANENGGNRKLIITCVAKV